MGITNFTDEQDKEIVQLARKFVDSGKVISWEVVARRMKHTRLGKHVLCERLKTMKKMYGKDLTNMIFLFVWLFPVFLSFVFDR